MKKSPRSYSFRAIAWVAFWWLLPLVVLGVWWLLLKWPFGGYDWVQMFNLWIYNFMLHGAGFWYYLIYGSVATILVCWYYWHEEADKVSGIVALVASASLVFSCVGLGVNLWDNDKDQARYYATHTKFYVPNLDNSPPPIRPLTDDSLSSDKPECDRVGNADVPSCIVEGTLPTEGWEARTGSFKGAQKALSVRSDGTQGVNLNVDTVTYLNSVGTQETPGWSGIMDGSGSSVPLNGVAIWTGYGDAIQCKFEGSYAIDRAFAGSFGNSMDNLVRSTYPDLTWDLKSVWGYCDGGQGGEPKIVIPVTTPIAWEGRTVETPAGIIIVQGDHGKAKLTYQADVSPGEYPGPVYSIDLAKKQREFTSFAAGRRDRDRLHFGFEPSDLDVQAGNVSEYLLQEATDDGRLVYVTPLTLKDSTSEVVVAYATIYADEVHADSVNELKIYVLADEGDPRKVNISVLNDAADRYVGDTKPAFKANGGKLLEYTPVDGIVWRVFAEFDDTVRYQLDISANGSTPSRLIEINTSTNPNGPSGTGTNEVCGKPFAELSDTDVGKCLQVFGDEAAARLGQN